MLSHRFGRTVERQLGARGGLSAAPFSSGWFFGGGPLAAQIRFDRRDRLEQRRVAVGVDFDVREGPATELPGERKLRVELTLGVFEQPTCFVDRTVVLDQSIAGIGQGVAIDARELNIDQRTAKEGEKLTKGRGYILQRRLLF